MELQRKQAKVGGQILSYLDTETPGADTAGPPILFLHGWGGTAESFLELMEQLRGAGLQQRFLALDFPGFGDSPAPAKAWSVSDYAECVVKFLAVLDLSAVDLVSHSFGGRVQHLLLAHHPGLVRKGVYIAPAGLRQEKEVERTSGRAKRLNRLFQRPILRPFWPLVRRIGYRALGNQDYLELTGVMKETFERVTAEDLRPLLTKISHPVRIYWGAEDSYVPVSDGEEMAETIPGAVLTVFPDGRHGIHRTHAAKIAQDLNSFLSLTVTS